MYFIFLHKLAVI